MSNRSLRPGLCLLSFAMPVLAWATALGWERDSRLRQKEAEVSTGVYMGMAGAIAEDPEIASPVWAALADGRIDNGEFARILDRTSTFTVPNADHWNPVAQKMARRRLETEIRRRTNAPPDRRG